MSGLQRADSASLCSQLFRLLSLNSIEPDERGFLRVFKWMLKNLCGHPGKYHSMCYGDNYRNLAFCPGNLPFSVHCHISIICWWTPKYKLGIEFWVIVCFQAQHLSETEPSNIWITSDSKST